MFLSEFMAWFSDASAYLISTFGYLGIFLVGFMGTATVVLPVPSYAVIFLAASTLNPFLVGVFAGFGAAIGELVAYYIGRGSRKVVVKKDHLHKDLVKVEAMFQKYGGFFAIIIVAATPITDNIVGIFCGMINYPVRKYFAASLIGKLIFHWIIAYIGFFTLGFFLRMMGVPA